MGKTRDAEKMKKKSKKNKNMSNGLLGGGDLLKEKGHKHREKERSSESNEDGDKNGLDKDNLVNDQVDSQKKRKSESNEDGDDVRDVEVTLANDSHKKRKRENEAGIERDCDLELGKKKKKKKKTDSDDAAGIMTEESKTRDKKGKKNLEKEKVKGSKVTTNETEKRKAKGKSKKVSFSGDVEVFPLPAAEQTTKGGGDGLVRGVRFTPEEDEILKEAVFNYIAAHGLGDDGLKMVLNCRSTKGHNKCWKAIGTCIPYRPYIAVYGRAHILFERGENRSWSAEEIEFLKEAHAKHGNRWKCVAEELGKHRVHVKDAWRRIKFENLKGGRWSQEEYQHLYDLVNLDLLMKVQDQEKKSKHGMLRDNIPWTAISEKLSTRTDAICCMKWYNQLTSSLVLENKWCDGDDYRLIGALYELDAACLEDVDWDNLLDHRPGDVCLKRWNQMVKHIGNNRCMPFTQQVDTLAKRYCPDLAETRDAWDKKPCVP